MGREEGREGGRGKAGGEEGRGIGREERGKSRRGESRRIEENRGEECRGEPGRGERRERKSCERKGIPASLKGTLAHTFRVSSMTAGAMIAWLHAFRTFTILLSFPRYSPTKRAISRDISFRIKEEREKEMRTRGEERGGRE